MIVHFMATKAFVKLNVKRLYRADGYAVKEVLKIVNILYSALDGHQKHEEDEAAEVNVSEILNVARVRQLQQARSLASQLTSTGATLHAYLAKEVDLREARNQAANRQLDSEWVEECLAAARDNLREEIRQAEQALVNVAADEATLDSKIEKRRNELERNQKRLSTLQSVRPAYMEEYEQLEEELTTLYSVYLTRFRNLVYLENLKEEMMLADETRMPEEDLASRSVVEDLRNIAEASQNLFNSHKGGIHSKGKSLRRNLHKRKTETLESKQGDFDFNTDSGNRVGSVTEVNLSEEEADDDDDDDDDDDTDEDDDENDDDDEDDDDDEGDGEKEDDDDDGEDVNGEDEEEGDDTSGGWKTLNDAELSIVGSGYGPRQSLQTTGNQLRESWSPRHNKALKTSLVEKRANSGRMGTKNLDGFIGSAANASFKEAAGRRSSVNYCNSTLAAVASGGEEEENDDDEEEGSEDRNLDSVLAAAITDTTTMKKESSAVDSTQNPTSPLTGGEKYSGTAPEVPATLDDDEEDF
ncbi:Clusterin-associated protein 1 [Sparganum proliferum]